MNSFYSSAFVKFAMLLVAAALIVGPGLAIDTAATSVKLLWRNRFDLAHLDDMAAAVTMRGARVFAVGPGSTTGTFHEGTDGIVRAYDVTTGELLWSDRVTGGFPRDVYAQGSRVFVAGYTGSPANNDLSVHAYEARTGRLIWRDQFDYDEGSDEAIGLAGSKGKIFVVGTGIATATSRDILVRAYDARTGELLWSDQFDSVGGADIAGAIAASQDMVFVGGGGANDFSGFAGHAFVVRAYTAENGSLEWEDQFSECSGSGYARAIATRGGQVFATGVCGNPENSDFFLRAYEAVTGRVLWSTRLDGGSFEEGVALAVRGKRVFTGEVTNGRGQRFVVRAHDVNTGNLLWESRSALAGRVFAISTEHGEVVASGWSELVAGGELRGLVRAYDARTGSVSWQRGAAPTVVYWDIATAGSFVALAGESPTRSFRGSDFHVRTYRTE